MFKNFFKKQKNKNEDKKNVLIPALLVHAAKIDENYTEKERKIIFDFVEIFTKNQKKTMSKNEILDLIKDAENYEIGRVQYKPNRLVIMNGAITHRHPGPSAEYTKENGFPFRTSMVVRGDEISLWEQQ